MSTILPPAASGPVLPSPPSAPLLTVAGGAAAAEIATLPTGSLLEAVVLPQQGQARNLLEVVTSGGTLILRIRNDVQLPEGANVVLQVAPSDGQLALRLTAVNGRLLLPGSTAGTAAPTLATAAALGEDLPAALAPDIGFTATLLRPASAASPAATATIPGAAAPLPAGLSPDLPPGTRLTLRIAGITPPEEVVPEGATIGAGAASPPTAPAGLPPVITPNPATPAAATPTPAAAGSAVPDPPAEAAASSSSPTPPAEPSGAIPTPGGTPSPSAAPPTAASPAPPQTAAPSGAAPAPPEDAPAEPPSLAATVLDHAPGGQALVQTPIGTLSLPTAFPLAPGSQLDLRVVGPPLPPLAPAGPANAPPPAPLTTNWPALSDALATLAADANAEASQQLAAALPQLNTQLAANLSLFASALEAGDDRPLLGGAVVSGLERAGKRDLVSRLKEDFQTLATKAAQPRGEDGGWRGFVLPMLLGTEVTPIHLYVHRPPRDEDQGGSGRQGDEHRFLVEVSLSRMGRMQFDGLVQRDLKRFDLIIRTDRPLSEEMRRDILGLFAQSSDAVGTKGGIVFQSGARFVDLPPASAGTRLMV